MHLSIRRKWCLHPLRSQLNRSNSHRWIRSRFQCWPLCGRATAHSCDIKAVFVTHLVKFYGTPLHVRYSVEPKGDTVRPDQWINGSIHVHMERRHVLVLNESQELVSERLCCSGWCRFVVEPFFKTVFNSFRDQCQGPSSYTTYRVGYRSIVVLLEPNSYSQSSSALSSSEVGCGNFWLFEIIIWSHCVMSWVIMLLETNVSFFCYLPFPWIMKSSIMYYIVLHECTSLSKYLSPGVLGSVKLPQPSEGWCRFTRVWHSNSWWN